MSLRMTVSRGMLMAAVMLATAFQGSNAKAALIYTVEFTTNSITGAAGTPWSVGVFLREQFGAGDTPILDPANNIGILTAGFDASLVGSTSAIGGTAGNPSFDNADSSGTNSTFAHMAVSQNLISPSLFGTLNSGDWVINIGTISGTFGPGAGVSTLSFDATTSTLFTGGNGPFSPGLGGSLTLTSTVSAVPEPSSMAMVGMLGLGLAGRFGLRWKRKK